MDRKYFITTERLTQYGFIHGNVEEDIILNCIWRVQETQLQPVLGTPLYNKLQDDIKAGLSAGDYYDLMINYVIPVLIPLVEVKITWHITNEIENKGVGKNSDEYMRTNSVADNNNLRDELRKDVDHYRNQLIKHLCDDNGSKYPEYIERTGNSEDMKPTDSRPNYENKISIL